MILFEKPNCFFAVILAATSLCFFGCGQKNKEMTKPANLPPGILEQIIQKRWPGQVLVVKNISYDAPFPSAGGRVPQGVKLFPAKVRVSIGNQPEEDVRFYFYQNPYGAWEGYTE